MALTGELTDLSLAELIEFFCNQRKTGRLKVIYEIGPGYFYLESGSVVHAHIGVLRGIEAVFYALTLRNASFNFSPAFEAPEHSINQPWTSVVLEGLRRMDEGIKPPNPFPEKAGPAVAASESKPLEPVERKIEQLPAMPTAEKTIEHTPRPVRVREIPFLIQPEPSRFGHGPWKVAAVFAAVLVVIAGIGVPWGWYSRSKAAKTTEVKNEQIEHAQLATPPVNTNEAPVSPSPSEAAEPSTDTAEPARRQREARQKEEARAKAKSAANSLAGSQSNAPSASAARSESATKNGSKKVTVQVTYDENGRVTQASGGDPTALRIARQKRFPAGKAGSATITIPIN